MSAQGAIWIGLGAGAVLIGMSVWLAVRKPPVTRAFLIASAGQGLVFVLWASLVSDWGFSSGVTPTVFTVYVVVVSAILLVALIGELRSTKRGGN